MDMDRYIGRLLDNRYEIIEVIGSGGMSVVYKARCHRLNRLVAIKILKDENSKDEDFRRRFHAESQAVAMLSHPNIVSVYDVSSCEDADYIVMELIEGITLKQYMEKKGVLNWKETLHFATQIAKALEHAHSRGLVHRDIKPHNVMVLKNGSVKVTDFGIARIMTQSTTLTKEALGSVHYISPEQAKGGRVDNRSDIYSLGVVMYEMISGRPPYDGDSPVAVAIQHINGGASLPSTINPNTPKGLEQIIMKAMSRDLRKRYPTATAMLYDLDEFRKNPDIVFGPELPADAGDGATRVITGVATGPKEQQAGVSSRKTEQIPTRRQQQEQQRKKAQEVKEEQSRSRVATIAVIACLVVLMVAIGVLCAVFLQDHGETPSPIRVPNLLGMEMEKLPPYDGVEVVQQDTEYNDKYPAGQIVRQQPGQGEVKPYGTKVYVVVSLGPEPEPVVLPAIEDMAQKTYDQVAEEIRQFMKENDLEDVYFREEKTNSDTVPAGNVISILDENQGELKNGDVVLITVSLGPKTVTAEMPDLLKSSGWDKVSAEGMMTRQGFKDVTWIPVNSLLREGRIVSQSVPAGEIIDVTTPIIIEYSNGIPPEGYVGPEVTITYTVKDLPEKEEEYTLSIVMNDTVVVKDVVIEPGQTSVDVQLTGAGTQECTIYLDGVSYRTEIVVFEVDGQ